jgi:short-subunit dehydrogenase
MNLQDKHILITGATGGIGSELSKLLHARGAHLLLNCISSERLDYLADTLGERVETISADISTSDGRDDLVAASRKFKVDVLINLAGILDFHWYEDQSEALINHMLSVNLASPMLLTHALLPQLLKSREAAIMNIGSTFGSIGHPGFVAYCASKSGMKGFSEALSRELADTPVRVQYIAPRATATPLNSDRINDMNAELGIHADKPSDVAAAIVHQLETGKQSSFLGWPEKLFVKINGLLPAIVHKSLKGKLPVIKRYARV